MTGGFVLSKAGRAVEGGRAAQGPRTLSPAVNARLASKLQRELKPGTRVVSHRFGIEGWAPTETVGAADGTTLCCGS